MIAMGLSDRTADSVRLEFYRLCPGGRVTNHAAHGIVNTAGLAVTGSRDRQIWTPQEDSKLLAGLQLHGKRWRKILSLLPHRSDSSVRSRAKRLMEECKADSVLIDSHSRSPRAQENNVAVMHMETLAETPPAYSSQFSRFFAASEEAADDGHVHAACVSRISDTERRQAGNLVEASDEDMRRRRSSDGLICQASEEESLRVACTRVAGMNELSAGLEGLGLLSRPGMRDDVSLDHLLSIANALQEESDLAKRQMHARQEESDLAS